MFKTYPANDTEGQRAVLQTRLMNRCHDARDAARDLARLDGGIEDSTIEQLADALCREAVQVIRAGNMEDGR